MSLTLTNVVTSIDRKTFEDCTISLMNGWGTVNCRDEYYYSFNIVDNLVVFDDWALEDVLFDCPEVIEALESFGFTTF